MNPTFIALLVVVSFNCVCTRKLPSYVTLCHPTDPKLQACILNAVEQIRPHMANGIPELFIPPMNPLILPEASLDTGDNFKASFKNIEVHYANEFKINHLNVDLDKIKFEIELSFPKLRIRSQYNVDGRILILQLQGRGPADGNLTDVTGRLVVDAKRYTKKGKEYISIVDKKMELNLGKPVFQFDNLFGDNKELNDQTNKVINENILDIIDELRPVVDQTVSEFCFGVVSRILTKFSFDELFPK